MEVIKNISKDRKSIVRAMTTSDSITNHGGATITIDELFIFDKGENGFTDLVVVMRDTDGTYISTKSVTVIETVQAILDVVSADEILSGLSLYIGTKKSKNNREFYYLELA